MSESSNKIRLLHVTVGLEIGGTEILLARFLPQLDPGKYDITVCALKRWGVIGDRLSDKGIKVVTLNGSGKFSFGVLLKLFNLVRKNRYDIVQSHLFLANMASAVVLLFFKLFSRPNNRPVFIGTEHELGDWQKWFHSLAGKIYYSLADRIVCCSQAVKVSKLSLFGLSGDKCEVIYNGISLSDFSSKEIDKRNCLEVRERLGWNDLSFYLIGTIGRLDNRDKGFNYLIRAISLIEKEINCRLLIIGSGPDRKSLDDLISELELTDRVKIIQEGDPSKVISSLDLFVLPSNSEGFGIVLLEAMAAGKPVVATRVGGIPEVVVEGETGLLVPARDPKALAEAIFYIKTHPMEAQEMGRKGRKRVEECFSIDKTVAEYDQFYDEIITYPAN